MLSLTISVDYGDEGLARAPIADMDAYRSGLRARVLASQKRNAMLVESYK